LTKVSWWSYIAPIKQKQNIMRTIETKVYQFSELSEKAKEKAIQDMYDINVYDPWWEFIYEDANDIGLDITGFDLRGSIDGGFTYDGLHTCLNILDKHGEDTETYKLAKQFNEDRDKLVAKYSPNNNGTVDPEFHGDFDEEECDLEEEFRKELLEEYLIILSSEYEYRTSEEAIIEAIEANEYEFTEDGKLF